jgi:hypothetical protein
MEQLTMALLVLNEPHLSVSVVLVLLAEWSPFKVQIRVIASSSVLNTNPQEWYRQWDSVFLFGILTLSLPENLVKQ